MGLEINDAKDVKNNIVISLLIIILHVIKIKRKSVLTDSHRRKPIHYKDNDHLSVKDVCVTTEYTIQKVYHFVLTIRIKRTIFLVLLFYELKTMTERLC